MPRNGSGQYSPPTNTAYPAVGGVTLTASDYNALILDLAAALTASICSDGQTPMAANLAMGTNRITGGAAAVATTDFAIASDITKGSWLRASPEMLYNASLTASVAGSALTIALKTAAGSDPSATDPVYVAFRSATAGTGTVTVRSVTSALSITVPSTATMGQSNATAARLWVGLIDNAGTVEIAAINTQMGGGQIYIAREHQLVTTTALSVAADSAGVWYSTSARTGVAVRLLGYIENTQATAGTWATTPSVIQTMAPGIPRPGDIIQTAIQQTGAVTSGTTTIPADNTTPQNTEGDQYLSKAITPTSAINILEIETQGFYSNSAAAGSGFTAALFQDSTANALSSALTNTSATNSVFPLFLMLRQSAGTTSSTTFKVRAGGAAAGATTFNGSALSGLLNGTLASYLRIHEVMA